MSDPDPDTSEWDGTPLVLGAGLSLEPREEGVHVEIVIADETTVEVAQSEGWDAKTLCEKRSPATWETLLQQTVERTFYKTQKYKEIANTLDERCPEHIGSTHLAGAFRSRCEALEANENETERTLQSPIVTALLHETTAVEYRRIGDESAVTVKLSHEGREKSIDFTPDEWVNSSGNEIEVRYFNAFFEEISLTKEDWDQLKKAWSDQAVDAGGDEYSKWDAVGEDILDTLRVRLDVYDDREAIQNGAYSAWYEESPGARMHSLSDDAPPVVWVRSLALIKQLKSTNRSHDDIAELVNHFAENGTIQTERKRLDGVTVYGCSPASEALNVNPAAVMDPSDDDDNDIGHGVEP